MRAFRTAAVTGVLLGAVVLGGCAPSGGDGKGTGSPAPGPAAGGTTAPGPDATRTTDPATAPATGPAPSSSPAPGPATTGPPAGTRPPAADAALVRVSRTGGFAGETRTVVVKEDGSWSRSDTRAGTESSGRLSGAALDRLRTALREADVARLPRISTGGPQVYDGYFFTLVHGGHEVAGAQESLPPALTRVLEALPPLTEG
ncbi:hypothetical protein ACFWUQ_04310 [Streptomyces sp. NPDC058662]|uniref:hypothetical protein n=1 Tax=Streptomyces sp. NPDC058662 TaxID=3346583 RepID=UPI00365ED3D3